MPNDNDETIQLGPDDDATGRTISHYRILGKVGQPKPLAGPDPDVDPDLGAIVMRALNKDCAARYPSSDARDDIDDERLAYVGYSWGAANVAPVVTAIEPRFKASILALGGFMADAYPLPDADGFNYASRVRVPTLMLNGKYDMVFGYDSEVKPMFEMIGVADEDKRQVLYESDHRVPQNGLIQESLDWLDQYLGVVE